MKDWIKLIVHNLLIILLFANLINDISANSWTVLLAYGITIVIGRLLVLAQNDNLALYRKRYFFLFAPLFLWILTSILSIKEGQNLAVLIYSPYLIIVMLLFACLKYKAWLIWRSTSNQFIYIYVLAVLLFFAFRIFPSWKNMWIYPVGKMVEFETHQLNSEINNKPSPNFKESIFLNKERDTISILSDKYTLIETWNEVCPPCLKAFKEMPSVYGKYKDKLNSYYVYESRKINQIKELDDVFSFESIPKDGNVLIDINQNHYTSHHMSGYPYFQIFDVEGNLVFSIKGYSAENKKEMEKELSKLFPNHE